jgi:hypothetical protein
MLQGMHRSTHQIYLRPYCCTPQYANAVHGYFPCLPRTSDYGSWRQEEVGELFENTIGRPAMFNFKPLTYDGR